MAGSSGTNSSPESLRSRHSSLRPAPGRARGREPDWESALDAPRQVAWVFSFRYFPISSRLQKSNNFTSVTPESLVGKCSPQRRRQGAPRLREAEGAAWSTRSSAMRGTDRSGIRGRLVVIVTQSLRAAADTLIQKINKRVCFPLADTFVEGGATGMPGEGHAPPGSGGHFRRGNWSEASAVSFTRKSRPGPAAGSVRSPSGNGRSWPPAE